MRCDIVREAKHNEMKSFFFGQMFIRRVRVLEASNLLTEAPTPHSSLLRGFVYLRRARHAMNEQNNEVIKGQTQTQGQGPNPPSLISGI